MADVDNKRGLYTQLLVFRGILVTTRSAIFRTLWNSPLPSNFDLIMAHRLYYPISNVLDKALGPTVMLRMYEAVKTIAFSSITTAIKEGFSPWKAVLELDSAIYEEISTHPFEFHELPPTDDWFMWDLTELDDTLSGFYLMTLSEMLRCAPSYEWLKPLLHEQIDIMQYGDVFKFVTFNLVEPLHPITGSIGLQGGKSALNTMIEEYAARSPTRAEMISRLRERPSQ